MKVEYTFDNQDMRIMRELVKKLENLAALSHKMSVTDDLFELAKQFKTVLGEKI